MKGLIKHVKADKILRLGMTSALVVVVIEILAVSIFFMILPQYIPLYNQMPWGEQRLGSKIEIFLPILITLMFFVLNFFLMGGFYEKLPLISRMLSVTTLIITILSLIFIIRTLLLVL